jgi:hypothetical protein
MSSNISRNDVAIRIGSILSQNSVNLFQSLTGDTLNIIGPAYKGKAFVPQNITDTKNANVTISGATEALPVFNTIENIIGEERKNRYRHLNDSYSYLSNNQSYDAIKTWLDGDSTQSTFTRVLGIGSGIKNSEGKYIGAGFNASSRISNGSNDNLTKSENPQAIAGGVSGNVSFLATKRESLYPGFIEDLGLDVNADNYFFDRIIISADGILPSTISDADASTHVLSDSPSSYVAQVKQQTNSSAYAVELLGMNSSEGLSRSKVNISDDMNNLKTLQYAASDSVSKENYWPERFLNRGHLVYARFPNSCQLNRTADSKLITTRNYSSLGNNQIPDFNSFESHYQTAKTPWVTSQPVNRSGIIDNREDIQNKVVDLFRFYSLDDGEVGNRFRIKINIKNRGSHTEHIYSTFDIYLFEYEARDNTFNAIDTITNVNLNPDSKNYICRRFGDENTYYDIDTKKTTTKVRYARNNKYLRVEVHPDVENKIISPSLLPAGFRAYPHIRLNALSFPDYDIDNFYQMPLFYPTNYFIDDIMPSSPLENNWGVGFLATKIVSDKILPLLPREVSQINYVSPHYYFTKYFLNGLNTAAKNIWVEDDAYLNSFFHLEKIYYDPATALADLQGADLYYSRKASQDDAREYIDLDDDSSWDVNDNLVGTLENKLSFDFFTYGGFDGLDIRDADKRFITNSGLVREVNGEDSTLSLKENPLFCAYEHAIDIATRDLLGSDILCLPGISNLQLAEKCISICEDRKSIIYLSDINTFSAVIVDDYLDIDNVIANYSLDDENDIVNVISVNNEDEGALSYRIDENFSKIIRVSDATASRFFIPIMGTLYGTKEETTKRLDPVISIIEKISAFNPPNISGNVNNVNGYTLSLLDTRLNQDLVTWSNDSNTFRKNKINVLFNPKTEAGLSILSQNSRHDERSTFFSTLRNMRTLNLIKKEIKFNLFTEYSTSLKGPLLFAQNSKIANINTVLDLQLRNVLNNFVNRGLINSYHIILPSYEDKARIHDLQNYILRGTIILKFNNTSNSDIINLRIDDILSELSISSEQSFIEIVQPTF